MDPSSTAPDPSRSGSLNTPKPDMRTLSMSRFLSDGADHDSSAAAAGGSSLVSTRNPTEVIVQGVEIFGGPTDVKRGDRQVRLRAVVVGAGDHDVVKIVAAFRSARPHVVAMGFTERDPGIAVPADTRMIPVGELDCLQRAALAEMRPVQRVHVVKVHTLGVGPLVAEQVVGRLVQRVSKEQLQGIYR